MHLWGPKLFYMFFLGFKKEIPGNYQTGVYIFTSYSAFCRRLITFGLLFFPLNITNVYSLCLLELEVIKLKLKLKLRILQVKSNTKKSTTNSAVLGSEINDTQEVTNLMGKTNVLCLKIHFNLLSNTMLERLLG